MAKDLTSFDKTLHSSDLLQQYIKNPIFPKHERKEDIENLSKKMKLNKITSGFLGVVAENGRLPQISGIISKFKVLMKAKDHKVEVKITTAKKLDDNSKKTIVNAIKKSYLAEKEIPEIEYNIDTSILGGLQLQVADKFLDLSVKNQISKVSSALSGSK